MRKSAGKLERSRDLLLERLSSIYSNDLVQFQTSSISFINSGQEVFFLLKPPRVFDILVLRPFLRFSMYEILEVCVRGLFSTV